MSMVMTLVPVLSLALLRVCSKSLSAKAYHNSRTSLGARLFLGLGSLDRRCLPSKIELHR